MRNWLWVDLEAAKISPLRQIATGTDLSGANLFNQN